METRIVEGKPLAARIEERVKAAIEAASVRPALAIVLARGQEEAAS